MPKDFLQGASLKPTFIQHFKCGELQIFHIRFNIVKKPPPQNRTNVQIKGGGGAKGLLNNFKKNCTFLKWGHPWPFRSLYSWMWYLYKLLDKVWWECHCHQRMRCLHTWSVHDSLFQNLVDNVNDIFVPLLLVGLQPTWKFQVETEHWFGVWYVRFLVAPGKRLILGKLVS